MEGSSGQRIVTSRRLDVAETPGCTLKVADMSGKALDNLDTCRHFDASQILNITDA